MWNKKGILYLVLSAIIILLIPLPSADIHLKIYFDEIAGRECVLYYETDEDTGYASERCIIADIVDDSFVDFRIDASLVEQITGLRVDMPDIGVEQVACVRNIEISSAGVIQKNFNPCYFFDPVNIIGKNAIPEISLVKVRKRAYVVCGEKDPYWILSSDLVKEIKSEQSDYMLTRLGIIIFLSGCYFSWNKKNFSETELSI